MDPTWSKVFVAVTFCETSKWTDKDWPIWRATKKRRVWQGPCSKPNRWSNYHSVCWSECVTVKVLPKVILHCQADRLLTLLWQGNFAQICGDKHSHLTLVTWPVVTWQNAISENRWISDSLCQHVWRCMKCQVSRHFQRIIRQKLTERRTSNFLW